MSHDRLSRHDIKHDEFVSGVTRAALWLEDNHRRVITGVVAFALALVVTVAARAWWHAREEKALNLLAEVERRYHATVQGEQEPVLQRPTPGLTYPTHEEKYSAVLESADALLARYGSGAASRQARYYRALALRDLGRHDEAATDLKALLGRRLAPLPRALARMALAETHEAAGRFAEAAAVYAELASSPPDMFPAEAALLGQARCLELENKIAEARAVYQRIVDAFPGSPYVQEAQERLRQSG